MDIRKNKSRWDFNRGAQPKMHVDEMTINIPLVRRLLAEQYPHLADLEIVAIHSTGTVNVIFRLGNKFTVRLPRLEKYAESLDTECTWLPRLAPTLSLEIPKPIACGKPTDWYPCPWAVYGWIEGAPYRDDLIRDESQVAHDLASFIRELRSVDGAEAPHTGRRPLIELDLETRSAIESCGNVIDTNAASVAWERSLESPVWDGSPVWIHGDLLRTNLLVRDGRLRAVIDFGEAGVGDPAMDVIPAWSVFNQSGREAFRRALEVEEATWSRARGYALHQALPIIPYYSKSNPEFTAMAKRTVEEILKEIN